MCLLRCHKHFTFTACGECKGHYCAECIDTHTYGDNTVCYARIKSRALVLNSAALLDAVVLCRQGLRSTLAYLGGFSGRG